MSHKIYVATHPAELIQTSGTPQLQPVSGTQLLYVNNTADSIFVNTADQNYYVLISGRWYRSPSLNGPWNYISPKKPATGLRSDSRGPSERNCPRVRRRHPSSSGGRYRQRHPSDGNRRSLSGTADDPIRRHAGIQADRRNSTSVRAQQPDSRDRSRPEFLLCGSKRNLVRRDFSARTVGCRRATYRP